MRRIAGYGAVREGTGCIPSGGGALLLLLALAACLPGLAEPGRQAAEKRVNSVPLCRGITLSANYLSETATGKGPGFQFNLANKSAHQIRLAEPVPSSSHWYSLVQGHWLWRASNGAGGSLIDPLNEHGRLVIFKAAGDPEKTLTVPAHHSKEWIESELENPVLEYKPGCAKCSYPGERDYRVIFAYAYLRNGNEKQNDALLPCGLRSNPVPMPPKP